MKGFGRGFTVIEVMIALAISGLMLASSYTVFQSRRESTEFSQSMYDMESKFRSYVESVSSQAVPGYETYTCAHSSVSIDGKTLPVLSPGSATSQECMYLGQAIQIIPNGDTIYSYPIFGLRTVYSGATDTKELPSTYDQANPAPALDASNPSNFLLVEPYPLLNGMKVVSATVSGGAAENDLLRVYSNLQDNNTSGTQITASSKAHSFTNSDVKSVLLRQCVDGNAGCAGADTDLRDTSWNLCVTNGARRGMLTIKATSAGVSTKLNMTSCS